MRGSLGLKKRLGFERLEARTVLNGTVMVTNAGGALTITGDASSNYYQVLQTGTTAGGGVNVRVTGFATKIDNLDTGKTGTTFTFTGVTSITVDETAGGSNHVTIVGTKLGMSGDLHVDMGSGNDILTVVNASAVDIITTLGGGNDVASFVNVRTTEGEDFTLDAGDGRDVVVLNNVHGPGNLDQLVVVLSSADTATFSDTGGTNGILVWKHAGNHFTTETDTGFHTVV
jgi:hypothetical protein